MAKTACKVQQKVSILEYFRDAVMIAVTWGKKSVRRLTGLHLQPAVGFLP
jgi:hypothetical protein